MGMADAGLGHPLRQVGVGNEAVHRQGVEWRGPQEHRVQAERLAQLVRGLEPAHQGYRFSQARVSTARRASVGLAKSATRS